MTAGSSAAYTILGVVLGVVAVDWVNLRRCLLLLAAGAAAVVALSWLLGHLVPYSVIAATNSQVAARVTPRLVDLVAALATGAVGSVALTRPDISDTLPGVAIAISLVPPLAVAGLTLRSGAPGQVPGGAVAVRRERGCHPGQRGQPGHGQPPAPAGLGGPRK